MNPSDIRWKVASVKMDRRTAQAINAALRQAGMDGNGRFRSVGHAHSAAGTVLEKYGYEFTDLLSATQTNRESASLSLLVSQSNPEDAFSPVEVENTALYFSYTKLGEDRIEVVAYMTY